MQPDLARWILTQLTPQGSLPIHCVQTLRSKVSAIETEWELAQMVAVLQRMVRFLETKKQRKAQLQVDEVLRFGFGRLVDLRRQRLARSRTRFQQWLAYTGCRPCPWVHPRGADGGIRLWKAKPDALGSLDRRRAFPGLRRCGR